MVRKTQVIPSVLVAAFPKYPAATNTFPPGIHWFSYNPTSKVPLVPVWFVMLIFFT